MSMLCVGGTMTCSFILMFIDYFGSDSMTYPLIYLKAKYSDGVMLKKD